MTDQQLARVHTIFAPNPAIASSVDMTYEFVRVATYGDNTPHSVVFMNDNGFLSVPVGDFETGRFEEWKDKDVLPTREVCRAAAHLVQMRME